MWADSTAITLNSYTLFRNDAWTLGFEFSPKVDITVSALGIFFPAGAADTNGVSLWDATSQNLLASTTVTGTGASTDGFLYSAIAPLQLLAGVTYVVGSTNQNDQYADNTVTLTADPNINYIQERFVLTSGNVPQFPNLNDPNNPLGANFQFAVPEPSIVMLLGMSCLSMLGLLRKWRI
jgi:WD40 repeat protein